MTLVSLCACVCVCVITIGAVRVLQTETGLVPFSDSRAVESQQVIVREHFNAVVVPVYNGTEVVKKKIR